MAGLARKPSKLGGFILMFTGRGFVPAAIFLTSIFLSLIGGFFGLALAQTLPSVSGTTLATNTPTSGERLSDWLLRRPQDPQAFSSGLSWQVPRARVTQTFLQNELLLQIHLSKVLNPRDQHALAKLVRWLPTTGRVRLPTAEARWLQAHPKSDPILEPSHTVYLPQRAKTITVLREDASFCTVPHQSGWRAMDYLTLCKPYQISRIDRVWVIQPDGSTKDFGVAQWNLQAQDELAPGALMWAPTRDSGWSEKVGSLISEFLATQRYDTILHIDGELRGSNSDGIKPGSSNLIAPVLPARDAVFTSNNLGMIGLLQTPTARFEKAGQVRFNFSRIYPYDRYNVFLQPFDWLEAGFRYTDIVNRAYGEAALSGDQTYKDKSIDFRVKLLEETAHLPQVALGMIDVGGTGLFSSEFIVANKRFGNFDWNLGVGWGNMGTSANVRNPLSLISKKFDTRVNSSSQGGSANVNAYFRGPTAVFGGLQYHTPWDKWVLKAEYEGNNYQRQPLNNNQTQRTPVNLGLVYRYHPSLDISLGVERGNAIMLGITLHASVAQLHAPKVSDPPTPRIIYERPTKDPVWLGTAADVSAMSGWAVRQIDRVGNALQVRIEGAQGAHWNERIERITAVLHRDAPASIDTFELLISEQGVVLTERVIIREIWARQNTRFEPGTTQPAAIASREPSELDKKNATALWERPSSPFGYVLVPSWQQNIGGPDGFLLFRAGLSVPMRYKINESTAVNAAVGLNILDNFDKFKYDGPSKLPRVRTNLRQYMTESRVNVPNLQLTHFSQLATNQYYSVYGGYLEAMFGGIGAEWLHRPWHSSLAFGVDVNYVQQRDFDQFFGFDRAGTQTGYRTATGHATAYWDTGWKSTHLSLSMGRYLAKDIGATVDISRTFNNGVSVGAWVTRTNVSAEQFGEGSFDKGMYLRIPFDVMTTTRSGDTANLVYNPLTRDGGARLNRSFTLHGATTARSKRDTSYSPAQ